MGIEPTSSAWEAEVLPLNYTRAVEYSLLPAEQLLFFQLPDASLPIMKIILNGEPRDIEPDLTVSQLIEQLGMTGKRLAIEIDREIVPRSRYAQTRLHEGVRLEIVHAIGGG